MPADESKGEVARVLFLTPDSKAILEKLTKKNTDGPLFLNSQGNPWTKDSVKCRLTRISAKAGFRVIAYGARHSYATEGLKNGVDSIVIAHLMGHKDTAMVAKVYSHLAKNPKYLADQAQKVKSA
jgi:site-specific recombinase XerD